MKLVVRYLSFPISPDNHWRWLWDTSSSLNCSKSNNLKENKQKNSYREFSQGQKINCSVKMKLVEGCTYPEGNSVSKVNGMWNTCKCFRFLISVTRQVHRKNGKRKVHDFNLLWTHRINWIGGNILSPEGISLMGLFLIFKQVKLARPSTCDGKVYTKHRRDTYPLLLLNSSHCSNLPCILPKLLKNPWLSVHFKWK